MVKPGWFRKKSFFLFLISLLWGITACNVDIDPEQLGRQGTATPTSTPVATPTITPTPTPEKYSMDGFNAFIAEVKAAGRNDRQELVNRYMVGIETTPFVLEQNGEAHSRRTVLFLWQGAAFEVNLIGDMTQFVAENRIPLTQVADTDLWYTALEIEPDARLDYLYEVDGQPILDRYNPHRIISGFGVRSELRLPGYTPPPELQPGRPITSQHGTLSNDGLESAILGYRRSFFVYTPAFPPAGEGTTYPSVYFQDGTDYINLINTPVILDWLIEHGHIPPLVAIFVPPINREREYNRDSTYVKFLTDELVPYIEDQYQTSREPEQTAIFGASMGGLISAYAALNAPNVFGLVGSQSGAFSFDNGAILSQLELQQPAAPLKFHLSVGTYDTALAGRDAEEGDLLAANEAFVSILRQNGYEFTYQTLPEGHSWGLWQAQIGNGLRYLFGTGETE